MRRLLSFAIFAVSFVLVLFFSVTGYAQTFRGAINGTITDPSGAVVAGANVKATNTGTGIVLSTVSTSGGAFTFQDVPLGTYKVSVAAAGFSAYTVDNVQVVAGTIYTLPIKLSMAKQATTVEVSAAALTVDTATQAQTMTIPADVVQNIPLNGRDYTQLISVEPGFGGYNVGGFGSLNGTRPNQMNWQIDGVDNNDFWHNIPAVNQGGVSGIAGIILPIDSIDEFSAQTQNGPEAGRNAGGTVNLVTKSGSNQLHGSAYYFNRNEFYAASSPFFTSSATVPKAPPLRNQNYGGSVGGPIIKDKTFYFLSFEKQNYIIGLSGRATEPSNAWIAAAADVLNNPGNKYGTYSPVPASTLSCTNPSAQGCSAGLMGPNGFWPRNLIGGLFGTPDNFFSPIASTGYSYNGVVKVDHNFNEKHHLSGRWFGGQGNQTAPLGGSPALGTASSNLHDYFEVAPIHVYNYSAVLNSAFSPRVTNQVLVGVNYFNQVFHDFNNSFDTRALGLFLSPDATIHGKPILGAPNIVISPPSGVSGAGFEQIGLTPPEGRNDITGHLTDIISYNVGSHQFRFGGEFRQARVNEFYHRRGTGKFTFDGTQGPWAGVTTVDPTTKALADFLAGDVSSSTIAVGNPERFVRVNAFNAYVQDAWQVTRKLNFNVGLRYEYFGPLHSDKKDLAVFVPGKGLLIQGNGIDAIFPPDRNNFAPRFGFAYQPKGSGDLVVRGGIGVYYDQINMNPFLDFRPPIAAAQGLEGNPIGPAAVSTYGTNILGQTSYNWQAVQQDPLNPTGSIFPGVVTCSDPLCTTTPGFNVFSVNQNFRTPYFYNYNLQVEKQFGSKAVWQIGYVGSEGRKLNIVTNINQNSCCFPNFGSILQLNSIGTSNYNALQSTFRIRSWHGLTSQFAYTWAHALDEISEYRAVIADDAFNRKLDYGNSDYDTRHLFTVSLTYDVPKASWANGWSKWLVNDWQVSSVMNWHKGQPSDEVRLGLDVIGDPFSGVSHSFSAANGGTQWWNPAAFALPASGIGNLARNRFYAPNFGDVDLSVFKTLPITERVRIRLQADMFNLFNRINLASGPGSVGSSCGTTTPGSPCNTSAGFGLVSDTIGDFNGAPGLGPGEQFNMQLAVKIIF